MADLFLSYATEDRTRAKSLAEALELRGWSVWWDKKIPLGQSFDNVIEDAIGAAKCVIVLWSRSSVPSEWVRSEASEGKRRGILVPVFLDALDAPLAFRLMNGADLSDWQPGTPNAELEKVTERVSEILAMNGDHKRTQVPTYEREQPRSAKRPSLRYSRLIGGLTIPLVAGILYTVYVTRTPRQPSTLAQMAATSASAAEKTPSASTVPQHSAVEDLLGATRAMAMTVFQFRELGLDIVLIPQEAAAPVGLSPGAVLWRVEQGGLGQAAGLHVGDVVAAINDRKITTPEDLRRVFKETGGGKSQYLIRRGAETFTVEIDCQGCAK